MGTCEHCGSTLNGWQQRRFCSKRCAGFRPVLEDKTCTRCGESLPTDAFRWRGGRPRSWCRPCEAAYASERARADIDAARARKAKAERRRRADPVTGPQLREQRRHYHRFRGSTPDDRLYAAILKADPCSYCGAPATEVDHIDPAIAGVNDHWTNLTAACRSCNAQKNDTRLVLWLGRRIIDYEEGRLADAA